MLSKLFSRKAVTPFFHDARLRRYVFGILVFVFLSELESILGQGKFESNPTGNCAVDTKYAFS